MLGVQAQTTNAGVLLEVGRVPLTIYAQKAAVKNWERIRNSGANHLLTMSYKSAQKESLDWLNKISFCLQQNGMGTFFIEEIGQFTPSCSIHNKLCARLKDIFHQKSFSSINGTDSKLRTYSLIKEGIGMESYLKTIRNINDRVSLSRFRLSNHKLMIEVGRYQKWPQSQCFCPSCPNIVEDEIHFLINCDPYSILRKPLFEHCLNLKPTFLYYTDCEKFVFIMTNTYLSSELAKFMSKAMEIRKNKLNTQ